MTASLKKNVEKKKKEFEFFEHTADVKFKAYGKTFEEALINAVKATVQVMTDSSKINSKLKKKVEIISNSKESLVYDFLEKIIFFIDTEGFLVSKIKNLKITKIEDNKSKNKENKKENKQIKYTLNAELEGDNAEHYDIHTQIKAVTYSDMKIEETKNGFIIQIVHDI